MTPVEQELVKATKFKGAKYEERQEYLAALLMAIDGRLSDDDYDSLSDEAVSWHTKAVAEHEAKEPISDFEEADEEPEEIEGEDEDSEAEEAAEEAAEEVPLTDPKHPLHRPVAAKEPEDEETGDAEPTDEEGEADAEADEEPEEVEAPAPKPAKKAAKPAKAVKPAKPDKAPAKKAGKQIDYTKLTGEKDKFGIIIGTKTHEAVKMYEKGVTAAQIMDALGGRHYNVLTKLAEQGHKVEKLEGSVWKLTHKDALKKKGK